MLVKPGIQFENEHTIEYGKFKNDTPEVRTTNINRLLTFISVSFFSSVRVFLAYYSLTFLLLNILIFLQFSFHLAPSFIYYQKEIA